LSIVKFREELNTLSLVHVFSGKKRTPHFRTNVRGGDKDRKYRMGHRVSSETSFVSKQLKLEPKLVSALSETRRLFRLFHFNIKIGSFGVLKQSKQTKDQPKQQQIC
jgi:hypothetical protein